MRRAELSVGEFYAAGNPPSPYDLRQDRWREQCVRVQVVEIGSSIVVVPAEDGRVGYRSLAKGERAKLSSARWLIEPWDRFEPLREEQRARIAARNAERAATEDADSAARDLADDLGVRYGTIAHGKADMPTAALRALLDEVKAAREG